HQGRPGPGGSWTYGLQRMDRRAGLIQSGFLVVRRGLVLLGELLELLREGGPEALDRGVGPVEAQLGGQLVFVEQALLARRLDRDSRLDRQRAVVLEPGGGRDQLADDDVLLEPDQAVALALERRVGEDLRRLLEGGG